MFDYIQYLNSDLSMYLREVSYIHIRNFNKMVENTLVKFGINYENYPYLTCVKRENIWYYEYRDYPLFYYEIKNDEYLFYIPKEIKTVQEIFND
jgi:hypothetical protein